MIIPTSTNLKSQIFKGATVGVALRGHPFLNKGTSLRRRAATEVFIIMTCFTDRYHDILYS